MAGQRIRALAAVRIDVQEDRKGLGHLGQGEANHLRAARVAPAPVSLPHIDGADAHLRRADPVLARLIDDGGPLPTERDSRGRPPDLYGALVRSIAGQQLSVKAAAAIWRRLVDRYAGRPPTPAEILAEDPEELRAAAGFSRAKVAYLRSLAERVDSGELRLEQLERLPDADVVRELTAVKGVGEWTAHMFLMFTLHRPDVLPVGDLGVRNAAMRLYGLDVPPAPAALTEIAEPWRPYRTRASLYLWRSLDNAPVDAR